MDSNIKDETLPITEDSGYSSFNEFATPVVPKLIRSTSTPISCFKSAYESPPTSPIKFLSQAPKCTPRNYIKASTNENYDKESRFDIYKTPVVHDRGRFVFDRQQMMNQHEKYQGLDDLFNASKQLEKNIPQLKHHSNILKLLLRNAPYLLEKVLDFLNDHDLVIVSQVSVDLRQIVFNSKDLCRKRNRLINNRVAFIKKKGKENLAKEMHDIEATHKKIIGHTRKALDEVQNSLSTGDVHHAHHTTKFDAFVKAGSNLSKGRIQEQCIRCEFPALVSPGKTTAHCVQGCKLLYCKKCLLPHHSTTKQCQQLQLQQSPRKRLSPKKLISNACRKRLKRL